jgi:hypothetical protein
MTRLPRLLSACACLGLLLASARPASAQNLLANPDFNTDLSGWNTFGAVFDGTAGSPSPGSAQFSGSIAGTNASIFVSLAQCVTGIVPGNTYDLSGQLRLTSAPAGGTVFAAVAWYSDAGCTTGISTDGGNPVGGSTFQASSGSFIAPGGAVAANFLVWISTSTTPGSFTGNLDTAFLGPQGPPPVPAISSLWLTLCAASLAAAGAMMFRRRQTAA